MVSSAAVPNGTRYHLVGSPAASSDGATAGKIDKLAWK